MFACSIIKSKRGAIRDFLSISYKSCGLNKWIRLDARGNKENVHADFSLEEERLAFPVRSHLGEIDFRDNNTDLDERLIRILLESRSILEVTADFRIQNYDR